MKTTIDLPDVLASRAKSLAHDQGVTLRELVVDGLRAELDKRSTSRDRVDFVFPTTGGQGLGPGVDTARLTALAYDLPT